MAPRPLAAPMKSDTAFALSSYALTAAGVAGTILFFRPKTPVPACTQDSECAIGEVCVNGTCVSCASASESCSTQCPQGVCPLGYICTGQGVCTLQGSCTSDSDCPVGSVCESNTCVPCSSVNAPCSSQCPQGTCPSGENCVQGVCEARAPSCPSGIACPSAGTCPCGYACVDLCCVPQCSADLLCCNTTCPSGYTCGPYGCCVRVFTGCSGPCSAPSDCLTGCTCSGGKCVEAVGTCSGNCTTNSDCASGCQCLAGVCSPLPSVESSCASPCGFPW